MRRIHGPLLVALLLSALPSFGGSAWWVEPEPARPQPGETIRLRLFEGSPTSAEPVTDAGEITRYQRIWNAGRENLLDESGEAATARFRSSGSGASLIALSTSAIRDKSSPERITRFAKAFVVVGDRVPAGQLHFSEVGHRLEIVPQTDPIDLVAGGGSVEVQILFDREPLAGVTVSALPRAGGKQKPATTRTDEIGLARLQIDRPGGWVVQVEHRTRCKNCGSTETERWFSTLYLQGGGS